MANCFVCRTSARSFQSREEGITYHRFPTTRTSICSKWKKFAGLAENSDVSTKRLCSRHFKADEFIVKPFRKNLRCGATPSLRGLGKQMGPKVSVPDPTSSDPPDSVLNPADSETSESNDELGSHVGSATIDHDYVATTNFRELQQEECPEKSEADLANQLLLDDVRKELCRLCGQKGSLLVPIFVMPSLISAEDVSVTSKIEMYLPFKVKKEDPLPSHMCLNCCEVLNHWHELYVTCVAANAVLWKTFGGEFNEESSDDLDDTVSSVQEEVQASKANIEVEIEEAEDQQNPSDLPISEETIEKTYIICAECGKNKTEAEIMEENTCNEDEEFVKNFALCNFSYKCKYCYELFKSPSDRKNHIAMCRQLSTLCELCGQNVSCRKNLRRHVYEKHVLNLRRYSCDKCDKCFKTTSGLSGHIKTCHEIQNTSPKYYCEFCCIAFVFESNFRKHQKKHAEGKIESVFQVDGFQQGENSQDSEKIPMFTCTVCEEVFGDMLSLVVHLTTKKIVKCSTCQKVLSSEKKFLLHDCGQAEWTCQYCLKTFKKKDKWIMHERVHTGERPIKCRQCDQMFRTWQARRYHESRHSSPYQCSFCGKSFRNKYVFQDHVSCHEGKVFLCCICNKKFGGRRNLWKHTNKFHKNIKETNCQN